jgi:lactate dehydrogenase-like 2-hydroxyacid dehydrogenase
VIRVAEHLILQILALTKKLGEVEDIALAASPDWGESRATDEDTFSYNWSGRTGIGQIWGRTLGIIGFGEIGVELARRLSGWGCEILYHKRTPLPDQIEQELGISYQDPAALLKKSDIVVNLLPYLPATVNYFNQTRIEQIKKGAILVSCGSGGTIDEKALAQAVESGHLQGAALDSFAAEPLEEGNPLLLAARNGENILLTPHTAGGTEDDSPPERSKRWRDYINILHYLNNEPLEYQLV